MNASVLPPGPLYILRGANSPVTSLHFTQTSLLSGTLDGTIHVWDLKTRRVTGSVDAHSGHHVLSICSDPQSTNIVTMGRDGFLKIWQQSESSYEPTGSIPASMLGFCGASALPQCGSSTYVALPEQTSDISVFDLASQKLVRNLAPSEQSKLGMCMCMSVVLDQSGIAVQLLAGYEDGSIILWDISTGKWLDKMTSHSDAVMCLAYSSTCSKGISGSVDEQLSAWSLLNSKLIATGNIKVMNPGFTCVVIRNDDKIAATGGWDGNVRVFGLKKLRPLAVLTHHKESVQSLAFSEDYLLAAGSKDHLITVWDIYRQM